MESEAELVGGGDPDALGADFITVELDTQPIEYVVKWAEVGSRFTISCVKKEEEPLAEPLPEEAFFAPYEEVFPCEVTEQSVEVKTDSDEEVREEEDGDEEEEDGEEEEDEEEDEEEGSSQLEVGGDSEAEEYDPEERQHRCLYCGRSYSHASSLYRHQQVHTGRPGPPHAKRPAPPPPRAAPYTCPHCGMAFKGSRMLGSHLRLHGKRRCHPCSVCGKEFNHSSSLSRHRLVHKRGKGSKDAPGPRPGGRGGKRGRRQRGPPGGREPKRAPLHPAPGPAPGETFYACPQCDMSFRSSASLSKHQLSHVRQLLGAAPPDAPSDLKIRLKLCSRDKPNVYALCGRSRRRGGRGASTASEEEEGGEGGGARGKRSGRAPRGGGGRGRFSCSCCSRAFPRRAELRLHQRSHQAPPPARPAKTYTCPACSKTFLHSSSYSRHKKAHLLQQEREGRGQLDEAAPLETDSE